MSYVKWTSSVEIHPTVENMGQTAFPGVISVAQLFQSGAEELRVKKEKARRKTRKVYF